MWRDVGRLDLLKINERLNSPHALPLIASPSAAGPLIKQVCLRLLCCNTPQDVLTTAPCARAKQSRDR